MLPNAPVLHFSISGELPLPGSPVGSASFCTCLATETQSDSAARLRFNISPLGKWRLIFSPRSVFVFCFFSVKVLAEVRYRWCFSMFACWGWWGSGQGSDILAHSVERLPNESKIKGRWCLLHVNYCCISWPGDHVGPWEALWVLLWPSLEFMLQGLLLS